MLPFEDKLPFESLPFEEEEKKAHIPRWPGDTGEKKITTDEDSSVEASALRGLQGVGEAALSIGTSIPATMLGSVAGLTAPINPLSKEKNPLKVFEKVSEDLTYAPRGEIGQKYVQNLGSALQVLPPVGTYVSKPLINAGRGTPKPIPREVPKPVEHPTLVENLPQEVRDQQAFYNRLPFEEPDPAVIERGDLSKQEGLPFTDSVEAVREAQVARDPQADMFVREQQLQRSFDPYQEALQKQADMERLDLQKMADEGAKQSDIDKAFADRQRMLFEEEQVKRQEMQTERLDVIEQRLRENKNIPRSELGAIDLKAVIDAARKFQDEQSTARDVFNAFRGAFTDREMDQALWHANDPRSKDTIALMSPAQFHALASGRTPSEINQWADRLHPPIREGLASKGGLWDIPFLRVEKDGQVSAHEGRHRMDVFKEMGVPLVPVRLHGIRWGSEAIPERLYPQDSKLVSPSIKEAFAQPMPKILTQKKTLNPQAGVIDIDALSKGLAKLRPGTRVNTTWGMGRIAEHRVTLIKDQSKLAKKLDELHAQAFQKYLAGQEDLETASARAKWLQDRFIKEEWINEPATVPTGAYHVDLDNGKRKFAWGSDIKEVFEGPKLHSQSGALDWENFGEALRKLRGLSKDSPELAPAVKQVQDDVKREVVYNSIPGLDKFRPIYDTPEKVLASLDKKDLTDTQLATAKTVKPGIRTVRVANNNPLIAFGQEKISKMVTEADKDARDYITSSDGVGPVWEKLSGSEKVELHRILKAGDAEQRRFTSEELAEAGYSKNQIDFMEKFYKMEDYELDLWNEQRLSIGMEPVKARQGHFRSVFKGDFWSLVMEKGEDGNPRIVGFVGTDTKMGYNKVVEDLKAKNPALTFTPMKRRGLSGSYRRSDLAQGMSEIMEWLGKNDPRMEQIRQAIQQITVQNADAWMGADLHALNKKGIWGNEGNKPWSKDEFKASNEAMKAYLTSWEEAVLSHRNLGVNAQLTALMQNPEVHAKWPNAVEYMNKYTKHMTGTYTSQLAATLNNAIDLTTKAVSFGQLGPSASRGAINQFTKRMGQLTQGFGNLIYMNMQFLQPFMTAFPEMYRAGNSVEIGASLNQGFVDAITYVRKNLGEGVNLTDNQKEMFKYAEDRGLLTFSEFDDVSRVTQSKIGRATDTAIDINRRAGELATRPSVFFTFVDLLRKHETIPEAEILDTAYNLTQYSMTDYAPTERPLMYRDLGVAGQLAGSLAQFKHSYVNQMAQWIKESPKKPQMLLAGLTAVAVLAGYRGLPGYDDLDSLVKFVTNKFGGEQKNIAQIVAENAPEWVSMEAPAFGAASAMSGVNISSRLGSAQLLPETPLEAVSPYMGKAAKIVEHAGQLGTNPRAAQNLGIELAPSSIRGYLEDKYSTSPEGMLINKRGQNEYQRSEFDRGVRKFGLQSLEEFQARDKVYQGTTNRQADADRRAKITGEVVLKATQLGKDWIKSDEFRKLKNEYIQRGGNPEDLINSIVKGKQDAKLTGKQRAEGTNPSDIGSIRRYQYFND
jgi:hypothetical protein